jgi:SAM-dependent methyltransferase
MIVPAHELALLGDLTEIRTMCELGNKKNVRGTYKNYFEQHGIEHVSIDINGEDGALPLDLAQLIIPKDIRGPFDVVTNFGTSEHVVDQLTCWRNILRLTKVNGYVISVTPLPGDWTWHGYYYPSLEWYRHFVRDNSLKKKKLFILGHKPMRLIGFRALKLADGPFIMPHSELMYTNKEPGD